MCVKSDVYEHFDILSDLQTQSLWLIIYVLVYTLELIL